MKKLVLLAAMSGCLSQSNRTAVLAGAAVGGLVVDWVQTRDIVRHCREANPVIGECGERIPPDVYFPVVIIGTLALASWLDQPWADAMLAGMAGAEAATVWGNAVR